jgi:hypothetical protein
MTAKTLSLLFAFVLGISLCGSASAQVKPTVNVIDTMAVNQNGVANQIITVPGSLKDGVKLKSLAWAWMSSNACFPGTQAAKFTGNHVLYVADLPPRSIMTVTVKPKSDSTNLSIYGYQIGVEKVILPEDLQYCVTCEADHERQFLRRGEARTSTRTMRFNAIGNPYKVVIGVAGANNLTEGDFTLEITLKQ